MKRTLTLALCAALGLSAACKKKEAAPAADPPAPTGAAAPTPPPTAATPDAAAAPAYSAAAAKQLLAELAACSSEYSCPAYTTLVGFGAAAGADLVAAVGDAAASNEQRRLIASAIGAIKVADAGPKLVELGSASDDMMLQSELFKAAGASGGQATFDALIAAYAKAIASLDDDREIPLRGGLRAFPAESMAWAKDQLPKAKDHHTGYADLVTDNAVAGDVAAVVALLGQTKDPMARHRLAAKAIALGDAGHFDVFVAGLQSKDVYDRSDAANFLAEVADQAPADLKAQLVDLLTKGKAGDGGGLTAAGYDAALAKLGAP